MRFLPSRPAGRIKKRRRPAHNSWTNLRRFFGLWMGCGHRCRNAICGRTPTKPGVSKGGAMPPLWHTTLLARCSVLYLLARLTGESGGGAVCAPLPSAGKRAGFCDREGTKTVRFQRAAAGIQSPHMQAETTILSIMSFLTKFSPCAT